MDLARGNEIWKTWKSIIAIVNISLRPAMKNKIVKSFLESKNLSIII